MVIVCLMNPAFVAMATLMIDTNSLFTNSIWAMGGRASLTSCTMYVGVVTVRASPPTGPRPLER